MKKQIYFIKENIIFSNETKEINFLKIPELKDLEFNKKNDIFINNKINLEKLKNILKQITNNNNNSNNTQNKIKISKPIKNYEEILKQILKLKKNNKLIKPANDDYEFIEKTSTIEILKQILKPINKSDFKKIIEITNNYILKIKNDEKAIIENNIEKLELEKNKIQKIKLEKKDILKKIEKLKKRNNELTKNIEQIIEIKKQLNTNKEEELKLIQYENKIKKFTKKENKIKYLIEDKKLDINFFETKINSLKDNIKLGKNKCPNFILLCLTLGISYWFKTENCEYKIIKNKNKINKIKEKIILLKKKLHQITREIDKIKELENNIEQKDKKEQLEIKNKNEELNLKNKFYQKNIENNQYKIEKYLKHLNNYDERNLDKINNKIIELTSIKEEHNKYSSEKLIEVAKEIEKQLNKQYTDLEKILNSIEKQKIEIKNEFICEI